MLLNSLQDLPCETHCFLSTRGKYCQSTMFSQEDCLEHFDCIITRNLKQSNIFDRNKRNRRLAQIAVTCRYLQREYLVTSKVIKISFQRDKQSG